MSSAAGYRYKFFVLGLGGILALLASCGKDTDPTPPRFFGREYLPLKAGQYIEYRLDTLRYNILAAETLQQGQVLVREVVGDSVFTERDYVSYPIVRYLRKNTSEPWRQANAYQIALNLGSDLIAYKEGTAELLLRTPCQIGNSWNRRAYENSGETGPESVTVTEAGAAVVGGLSFDSVLTVSLASDSNCLNTRRGYNQFAAGIGLIKQLSYDASFVQDAQNPCQSPAVYQIRTRRELTVTGYGKR